MEFGRITEHEISRTDFSLPPEPADNKLVLKKAAAHPNVYIGCARWGVKEWVGKLYPKGTRATSFLEQYVKHFNTIELNATHYKIYGPGDIAKWAEQAGDRDFKFCPKVPQIISHNSGFNDTRVLTDSFLEGIIAFGEHLGPIFLQVSESYHPRQRDKLFAYLQSLPTDLQFFLEVRHPDWFADGVLRKELFDTLRSLNVGAVITDTPGRRDVCHMELTVPKTFIRFVANSLHDSDYTRIESWVGRIRYWLQQGLQELYFFMHMHEEIFSPELIEYFVDALNEDCGLSLKKPLFAQGSLFEQFGNTRKRVK